MVSFSMSQNALLYYIGEEASINHNEHCTKKAFIHYPFSSDTLLLYIALASSSHEHPISRIIRHFRPAIAQVLEEPVQSGFFAMRALAPSKHLSDVAPGIPVVEQRDVEAW